LFPVYVGLPDAGVVETREDFLMAGFLISDGRIASINFGVVDGVLAINGINYSLWKGNKLIPFVEK